MAHVNQLICHTGIYVVMTYFIIILFMHFWLLIKHFNIVHQFLHSALVQYAICLFVNYCVHSAFIQYAQFVFCQ